MKKGRFKKIEIIDWTDKCFVLNEFAISCKTPEYYGVTELSWKNYISSDDVTDFINKLCHEFLRSSGLEYNKETGRVEKVIYLKDINLVPGERFFGIEINEWSGLENNWEDLFPHMKMKLDILNTFRCDLRGYYGISSTSYRLYLPYTEENLEIYQKYTEYNIMKRFGDTYIKRKIKIDSL